MLSPLYPVFLVRPRTQSTELVYHSLFTVLLIIGNTCTTRVFSHTSISLSLSFSYSRFSTAATTTNFPSLNKGSDRNGIRRRHRVITRIFRKE